MPANLENSAVANRLEEVTLHTNMKEKECHITMNAKTIEYQKEISMCFIIDCTIMQNVLEKIRIPEQLIVFMQNLDLSQKATVLIEYGKKTGS